MGNKSIAYGIVEAVLRLHAPALMAALPAVPIVILAYAMPPQYEFILENSSERVLPLVLSTALWTFYTVISLCLLRGQEKLSPTTAFIASLPILSQTASFLLADGAVFLELATAFLSVFVVVAAYAALKKRGMRFRTTSLFLTALLPFAAAAVADVISPIDFPRLIGAIAILAIFLSTAGVLFQVIAYKPVWSAFGIVAVVALAFIDGGNDHAIPQQKADGSLLNFSMALEEWLDSRKDLGAFRDADLPYPVFIVSSEGGGIYAAAHAYQTLSILSAHCPTFSQHVFATVGISGGALGNALFNASAPSEPRAGEPCSTKAVEIDRRPVEADHFSPVFARFVLLETIDRLLPGRIVRQDRGLILSRSFSSVAADSDFMETLLRDSWDPRGAAPATVSVSTNMADGTRLVFAPFGLSRSNHTGTWWGDSGETYASDISVVESASAAARFPWLTPTGTLKGQNQETETTYTIADGGYFENSGAETALDIIREMRAIHDQREADQRDENEPAGSHCGLYVHRQFAGYHTALENNGDRAYAKVREPIRWEGCDRHIFPILLAVSNSDLPIDKDEDEASPVDRNARELTSRQSFLLDPIRTLINTRSSRGALALQRAASEQCASFGGECVNQPSASIGFFRSAIRPDKMELLLGWHIQPAKIREIARAAVKEGTFDYRTRDELPWNDMAHAVAHLDVSLFQGDPNPFLGLIGSP